METMKAFSYFCHKLCTCIQFGDKVSMPGKYICINKIDQIYILILFCIHSSRTDICVTRTKSVAIGADKKGICLPSEKSTLQRLLCGISKFNNIYKFDSDSLQLNLIHCTVLCLLTTVIRANSVKAYRCISRDAPINCQISRCSSMICDVQCSSFFNLHASSAQNLNGKIERVWSLFPVECMKQSGIQ